MLIGKNIHKRYGTVEVLRGVDIDIKKGEIVSIVGSSGAGKSTLLHILGTLDTADKGAVRLDEADINSLQGKKLADFRNKNIGFVFQFHHLLPEFTALENVCIPGWLAGRKRKEVENKAKELLTLLGLAERLENKPNQMSGGEQQRVAVARALINSPSIVFADEPTGNLDSENGLQVLDILHDVAQTQRATVVMATHSDAAAQHASRIIHMKDGRIL